MIFNQLLLRKREGSEEYLGFKKINTAFKGDIGSRKWIKFVDFNKGFLPMFSLRSKTAEKRVDGFVGEFLRFKDLVHVFKEFDLKFGFVGMIGPFLELPSDNDMNS